MFVGGVGFGGGTLIFTVDTNTSPNEGALLETLLRKRI